MLVPTRLYLLILSWLWSSWCLLKPRFTADITSLDPRNKPFLLLSYCLTLDNVYPSSPTTGKILHNLQHVSPSNKNFIWVLGGFFKQIHSLKMNVPPVKIPKNDFIMSTFPTKRFYILWGVCRIAWSLPYQHCLISSGWSPHFHYDPFLCCRAWKKNPRVNLYAKKWIKKKTFKIAHKIFILMLSVD